jgi:phosphatidylserine synthase
LIVFLLDRAVSLAYRWKAGTDGGWLLLLLFAIWALFTLARLNSTAAPLPIALGYCVVMPIVGATAILKITNSAVTFWLIVALHVPLFLRETRAPESGGDPGKPWKPGTDETVP